MTTAHEQLADIRGLLHRSNLRLRDTAEALTGLGEKLLTPDEVLDLVYGASGDLALVDFLIEGSLQPRHGDERTDAVLASLRSADRLARVSGERLQDAALLTPAADLVFGIRRAIAFADEAWLLWTHGEHRPVRPGRAEA